MTIKIYDVAFFNNVRDSLPKKEKLSFEGLIDKFSESLNLKVKKTQLPAMVCGKFDSFLRSDKYLTNRSIITYDIDNYPKDLNSLLEYVENSLKSYTYIYYTTINSIPLKPKLRLLLFPSKPITKGLYGDVAKGTAKLLLKDICEYIDECSYKANQLMFLPIKTDDNFKRNKNVGDFIDTTLYLKDEEVKPLSPIKEFEMATKNAPLSNLNDGMVEHYISKCNVENTDYHKRLKVCQALHHQYSGSAKGLDIYTKWRMSDSRIGTEYVEEVELKKCKEKYYSFKLNCNNPITMASIIKEVKEVEFKKSFSNFTKYKRLPKTFFHDVEYDKQGFIKKIQTTYQNFLTLCEHYNIKVGYDCILKTDKNNLNLNQNDLLGAIQSTMILNDMNHSMAAKYISMYSKQNTINSFRVIMEKEKWDGVDRLQDFYDTITVPEGYKDVKELYLLKWIQQMLYLTLYQGDRKIARNLLVFQSNQECGKGTWFNNLLPAKYKEYLGEGLRLDPSNSMSVLMCISNIFTEISEIDTLLKKIDIGEFKAFFGRTEDVLNMKYVTFPVTYQRTTSFLGTANDVSFLKDKTGSTRFLILPVIKLNGYHKIDMIQLYRQVYVTTNYVDFELNDEQKQKQALINEDFQEVNYLEEEFKSNFETIAYEKEIEGKIIYFNCTEVLEQLGYDKRNLKSSQRRDMADILRKYNFKHKKSSKKYLLKIK